MSSRSRPAAWKVTTLAVAAACTLAGCASGPATLERGSPAPRSNTASDEVGAPGLEALRTKTGFLTRDECATGPPAQVFTRCGRFTVEVRNIVGQVRRDAPAAGSRADATEQALDRFSDARCQASPGAVGGGDPAVCGPAFAAVQAGVQGIAGAVGAS
ncbi:hypothetical protein [Pseudonocardia phyllosphaerae]|uniref:hypothetical protein n=1 Tax=Pseudonocardia phyllosphaerae TaxID=3390502 RepID=UPI003979694B